MSYYLVLVVNNQAWVLLKDQLTYFIALYMVIVVLHGSERSLVDHGKKGSVLVFVVSAL